jgi:hypothetical protein
MNLAQKPVIAQSDYIQTVIVTYILFALFNHVSRSRTCANALVKAIFFFWKVQQFAPNNLAISLFEAFQKGLF